MNWDAIEQLLNIAEKSLAWPDLKPIHDFAMAELRKHIVEAAPKPKARPEKELPDPEPETDEVDDRRV